MRQKPHRFPLHLTEAEAEAVNEFRWQNRLSSQTEAVRRLIGEGLKAVGMPLKDAATDKAGEAA